MLAWDFSSMRVKLIGSKSLVLQLFIHFYNAVLFSVPFLFQWFSLIELCSALCHIKQMLFELEEKFNLYYRKGRTQVTLKSWELP